MPTTPEGRWYSSPETRFVADFAHRSWQAAEKDRRERQSWWKRRKKKHPNEHARQALAEFLEELKVQQIDGDA